jgi:transglutaminase-like putative cysteine protease
MLIRLGYDIQMEFTADVAVITLLHVHPSREKDLREPDQMRAEPYVGLEDFTDQFGNHACRFLARPGVLRLHNSFLIEDSGQPDAESPDARQIPVEQLPTDVLAFLTNSRYCEVDLLSPIALELFGDTAPGWNRVRKICEWVHSKVAFGYRFASSTRTALGVYTERVGVCRDFQHLAITFCRAMNIPARYATGYLGDIRIDLPPSPMDFSAWFEVYLEDRWWTFDARHNVRRVGRVLMATGRDATDCAITTSFGTAELKNFTVISDEVKS